MKLTTQEVQRFYHIWFNLLNYVNEKRNLVPTFAASWRAKSISPDEAVSLRDALWKDDSLREAFILENPLGLAATDLDLVKSWQHRVSDNFFITQYMKNHAVFIADDNKGYAVHGITDSLEEMTGGYAPIYVKTVLIPFEDRIIYDSLLSSYPVTFGGGYKSSLKDSYRTIQERGGLISQLPPSLTPSPTLVRAANKKVLTAFKRELGKSGLSPKKIEEHSANLAAFSETFLVKQAPPIFLLDITANLIERYEKQLDGKINWVSFKRFVRFLRDTYRIDWEEAEDLMHIIKDQD